jgi:hemerythrin-like domain-containing protein
MSDLKLRKASRRIASQHHRLESFYSIVSNALARGEEQEADAGLTSFIDALDAHFTLEESEWFPALAKTRSTLRQEVSELAEEHEKFRHDLEQVRKRLRMREFEASIAYFDYLLNELARHDDREERMLASIASADRSHSERMATGP